MSVFSPPIAKKIPFKHPYTDHLDYFHWLKDQNPNEKRKEIIDHLQLENSYCDAMHLTPNRPLTNTIYNEIIARIQEDDTSAPVQRNDFFYYSRTVKDLQYPIYARKKGSMEAPEEIILNQNEMSHEYMELGAYKILAYSLDTNGSEFFTIFFFDLENQKLLEMDTIQNVAESIQWTNDSKAIYYLTLDEIHRPYKLHRHIVGTNPADDQELYHEKDEKFSIGISKTNSNAFVIVSSGSTLTDEVYYIDASNATATLKLFSEREYKHKYFIEHQDSRFLIVSDKDGKLNNQLYSCSLENTCKEEWKPILEYDPLKQLIDCIPFKDALICNNFLILHYKIIQWPVYQCFDGLKHLLILKNDGSRYYVDYPELLYFVEPSSVSEQAYESQLIRFEYESMLTAPQIYEFNFISKTKKLLKETAVLGGYDKSLYTMKRIYATIPKERQVNAPFDTPVAEKIPISLVYKTSEFKGDGSNACLLYGYGSYGISIDPSWSFNRFSLIDRGFVYAIAHIRGGGDCGRGWYETGKFLHKKNTFYDFIDCRNELLKQKFTSESKLAIEGRSAGGMLIGATMNLCPNIAHVAIAGVPFVDVINTMMDPSIPLTINEYEEWGNPQEDKFFDYMKSYSPYENIQKGQKYPNLLVKAGINDPRVQYWEPAKWVCKLRDENIHLNDPNRMLLFDCKMGSGHFGASGRYAYLKELAADYAFIIERIMSTNSKL